jgi:hypothetical protein
MLRSWSPLNVAATESGSFFSSGFACAALSAPALDACVFFSAACLSFTVLAGGGCCAEAPATAHTNAVMRITI